MKKWPTESEGGSVEVQAEGYYQAREPEDELQSLSETGSEVCLVYPPQSTECRGRNTAHLCNSADQFLEAMCSHERPLC